MCDSCTDLSPGNMCCTVHIKLSFLYDLNSIICVGGVRVLNLLLQFRDLDQRCSASVLVVS